MDVDEEKTHEINGTDSNDHVNGVTPNRNQEGKCLFQCIHMNHQCII